MKLAYPILICLFSIVVIVCTKEKSCEGCYEKPIRITPNDLLTRCSIYINDESLVRKIYVQETNKYYPNTYKIFDSILMTGEKLYKREFDLKNYLDIGRFKIGDSFFVRYGIRYRFEPEAYVFDTILIY